jgi:hypothetical protein
MKRAMFWNRWLIGVGLIFTSSFSSVFGQVSSTSFQGKVIVGYQGWFGAKTDGSQRNDWNHWQIRRSDGRITPATDLWPKMGEYPETYNNNWTLRDGTAASVFSSYDLSTVKVHFKWMKNYGIDGAFVGRQTKTVADGGPNKEFRDQVLRNVANACADSSIGRVFYINYDISEEENNLNSSNVNGNVFARIEADADFWLTNANGFTSAQKGRYQTINGKPVIRIFGVGSRRNLRTDGVYIFNAAQAKTKLTELRQKYTVMLGINKDWRTLDNSNIRSDWTGTQAQKDAALDVWRQADYLQPWTVNAFPDTAGADNYYQNRLRADIQWGKDQSRLVNIVPVIWPGFSWRNLKDGVSEYNQVGRQPNGGFYWNCSYESINSMKIKESNFKTVTVAMFDELDEGTAIMKVETSSLKTPNDAAFSDLATANAAGSKKEIFVTNNVGGPNAESDYFLWLTQQLKTDLTNTVQGVSGFPRAAVPAR